MAIASYWASECFTKELDAVTDVQAVYDQLIDQLVNEPAAADKWTDLGGGVYRSPSLFDVYLQIELAVLDTEDIAITVKRNSTTLMSGRFRIDNAGSDVRVYTGPGHVGLVADLGSAVYTSFWASLADTAPILPPPWDQRAACWSSVDAAGSDRPMSSFEECFAESENGAIVTRAIAAPYRGSAAARMLGLGGKQLKHPCDLTFFKNLTDNDRRQLGTLYGLALVDTDNSFLGMVDVEVDTGTVRDFDVLPLPTNGGAHMAIQRGTVL